MEKGAEVDSKDEYGRTALMVAAGADNAKVVRLLLERGAEVNSKDKNDKTALMCASEPLIEVEGDGPEPPRIEYDHKGTTLRLKVENGAALITPKLSIEIIELLRAHGAKE